jgi:hypothetical protein
MAISMAQMKPLALLSKNRVVPFPQRSVSPHLQQRVGKSVLQISYDFDKTVSEEYMQDLILLPALGFRIPKEFWELINQIVANSGEDSIQAYMQELLKVAKKNKQLDLLSVQKLREFGAKVPLAAGVPMVFPFLKQYGNTQGVTVEQHIISSGLKEMIQGSSVAPHMKSIHGNRFKCDLNGRVTGIEQVIQSSDKPESIKNILDKAQKEHDEVLAPVYVGDGETDVPAWKYTQKRGGYALMVYDPNNSAAQKKAEDYLEEGIVDAVFPRNFQNNSLLVTHLKRIIDFEARREAHRADSKPKLFT